MTQHDVVPKGIVRTDIKLREDVERKQDAANTAQRDLDQYRWEQCKCPRGPKISLTAYARAVGLNERAIHVSIKAWGTLRHAAQGCTDPTHPGGTKLAEADKPSAEEHTAARVSANRGERESLFATALAAVFDVSVGTPAGGSPQWAIRLKGCKAIADGLAAAAGLESPTEEQILTAAAQIKTQADAHDARLVYIQDELAKIWGVKVGQKTAAKDLARRAAEQDEKTGEGIDSAVESFIEWERKAKVAADHDEDMRRARGFIEDVEGSALAAHRYARTLTDLIRDHGEDIRLPEWNHEQTVVTIKDTIALLSMAQAFFAGDSGTNWDPDAASLRGER